MAPRTDEPWHALAGEEVLRRLATSRRGLAPEEARRRLARYGPNRLPEPPPPSPLARFLRQFHDLLIYLLLLAAAITLLLGELVDTAVILAVVLVNAAIGFWQEGRAERAMAAIRRLLAQQALVVRGGHRLPVAAEELVPGDLVVVTAGDRVPADLRLLEAAGLEADESVLTGESVPVAKTAEPVRAEAPLAERRSMLHAGTLITRGRGLGVVVATGPTTEVGRIGRLLEHIQPQPTPLARRFRRFSRRLTGWILALAGATLALGVLVHGRDPGETFMAAVGLAVAAIPEGLPAIVSITMAIGVERMARRRAIVRRLPVIETLGSVDVVCSDKTGTFTKNEMTVEAVALAERVYTVTGSGYAPHGEFRLDGAAADPADHPALLELLEAAVHCSDAELRAEDGSWRVEGDPTEGALLVAALKAGLEPARLRAEVRRLDEIPFDPERRFMAVLVEDRAGRRFIHLKGAPERLLALCRAQRDAAGGTLPLETELWVARMEQLAARGDRLLAVASCEVGPEVVRLPPPERLGDGFVLLGIVGLLDPPRPEAITAVAACQRAGIRVKMITGDHAATARAIARRLGLANPDTVLTGPELDRLDDDALAARVAQVDVFARTTPEHKLRLVELLQRQGHVVAMTGDGVNDAPALRRADVGIAMGRRGSEAAKEAADMVLADDDFATIAAAIAEGRTVYDNIRKAVAWILPTNGAESLVVFLAVAAALVLPLSPVQVLWVNTVTTITLALAFAFEPPEPDVMARPPRRSDEPFLAPELVRRLVLVSVLGTVATFAAFELFARSGASLAEARTAAVHTLVAVEAFYLFAARRITEPALAPGAVASAGPAALAFALVVGAQLLFTYGGPLTAALDAAPVGTAAWGLALVAGGLVLLVVEGDKWWHRRRMAASAR